MQIDARTVVLAAAILAASLLPRAAPAATDVPMAPDRSAPPAGRRSANELALLRALAIEPARVRVFETRVFETARWPYLKPAAAGTRIELAWIESSGPQDPAGRARLLLIDRSANPSARQGVTVIAQASLPAAPADEDGIESFDGFQADPVRLAADEYAIGIRLRQPLRIDNGRAACIRVQLFRVDAAGLMPILKTPLAYEAVFRTPPLRPDERAGATLTHQRIEAALDPSTELHDGRVDLHKRQVYNQRWETFRIGRRSYPGPVAASPPAASTVFRWNGAVYEVLGEDFALTPICR